MKSRYLLIPGLTLILIIWACSTTDPTGSNGSISINISINLPDEAGQLVSAGKLLKTNRVDRVTLRVKGPDMDEIVQELNLIPDRTQATGTVDVPKGDNRIFIVIVKDEFEVTQYVGGDTVDVLDENLIVNLTAYGQYPAAVTLFTPTVNANSVDLAWSESNAPDFDHYEVARATSETDLNTNSRETLILRSNRGNTTYTDNTPSTGVTYFYAVIVWDTESMGMLSESAEVTLVAQYPDPVTLFTPIINQTSVDLSWSISNAIDFDHYEVARATSEADLNSTNRETLVLLPNINTTSYTDNTPSPGTTYYYAVVIWDTESLGMFSNYVQATVEGQYPQAVTVTATEIGAASVILNWTVNTEPDFDEYEVVRSNNNDLSQGNRDQLAIITSNTITMYADESVQPNTQYYYAVVVRNTGGLGMRSNAVGVQTGGERVLTYDDGSFENFGFSLTPEDRFEVEFTAPQYPAFIRSIQVKIRDETANDGNYRVYVEDSQLGEDIFFSPPLPFRSQTNNPDGGWVEWDLVWKDRAEGTVNADFFSGIEIETDTGWPDILLDTSTDNDRSQYYDITADQWFSAGGNWLIRVVVEFGGRILPQNLSGDEQGIGVSETSMDRAGVSLQINVESMRADSANRIQQETSGHQSVRNRNRQSSRKIEFPLKAGADIR